MLSSVQFRIFVRLSSEVQNNGDRDRKCSGDLRSSWHCGMMESMHLTRQGGRRCLPPNLKLLKASTSIDVTQPNPFIGREYSARFRINWFWHRFYRFHSVEFNPLKLEFVSKLSLQFWTSENVTQQHLFCSFAPCFFCLVLCWFQLTLGIHSARFLMSKDQTLEYINQMWI